MPSHLHGHLPPDSPVPLDPRRRRFLRLTTHLAPHTTPQLLISQTVQSRTLARTRVGWKRSARCLAYPDRSASRPMRMRDAMRCGRAVM